MLCQRMWALSDQCTILPAPGRIAAEATKETDRLSMVIYALSIARGEGVCLSARDDGEAGN